MLGAAKTTGIVLDVARQRGGATPSIVTLHDFSRFGNDGAMTNVTWVQLPSDLWVMYLNGTSSVINCGSDASFNMNMSDFTLEFWINTLESAADQYIFDRPASAWYLTILIPGRPYMKLQDHLANRVDVAFGAAYPVNDGVWHHVVIEVDRANNLAIGYKDTVLAMNTGIAAVTGNLFYTGNFTIGRAAATVMEGYLSLIRIYNYALTPAQVRSKFTATRRLFGV